VLILITKYNVFSFGGGSQMMRRRFHCSMTAVKLLAIVFMLVACEVEFTPQITPLVVYAPGTPSSFGTVVVAGTLSPFDATGTAEAILSFSPVPPTVTPTAIVSFEEGSIWNPTFERVECGTIDDDVCYELCYGGHCYIYGDDDDRVALFVDKLEKRDEKIDELELTRAERGDAALDAFGTCAGAGAAAGTSAVTIIAIANPEPLVSKIIAGISGGATLILCGGAIRNAVHTQKIKEQQIIDQIEDKSRDAIFEFQSLQQNPP
jgi:hypothetical protein